MLPRIAAVAHALCDRDEVKVPNWVWRHRSRRHIMMGGQRATNTPWTRLVQAEAHRYSPLSFRVIPLPLPRSHPRAFAQSPYRFREIAMGLVAMHEGPLGRLGISRYGYLRSPCLSSFPR